MKQTTVENCKDIPEKNKRVEILRLGKGICEKKTRRVSKKIIVNCLTNSWRIFNETFKEIPVKHSRNFPGTSTMIIEELKINTE